MRSGWDARRILIVVGLTVATAVVLVAPSMVSYIRASHSDPGKTPTSDVSGGQTAKTATCDDFREILATASEGRYYRDTQVALANKVMADARSAATYDARWDELRSRVGQFVGQGRDYMRYDDVDRIGVICAPGSD